MKDYYVYMLTNWNNKVLYIGVTNNLERRMYQHKHKLIKGFSSRYNLNKLVYFEYGNDVEAAIAREKQLKGWLRQKKNVLVESINPAWNDLSEDWSKDSSPSVQNDSVCHPEQSEESYKTKVSI